MGLFDSDRRQMSREKSLVMRIYLICRLVVKIRHADGLVADFEVTLPTGVNGA